MLKRLTTPLHILHSYVTPTFHVTQLLGTGDQHSLHVHHTPGQGYTLHEEYHDPRQPEALVDSETWEDTPAFMDALKLFQACGASPAALQAARAKQTATILVPLDARLEVITKAGDAVELDLHLYADSASFIQVFQQVIQTTGQPLNLIGRSGDHEVAWQAVFDPVPWGAEARRQLQEILNH